MRRYRSAPTRRCCAGNASPTAARSCMVAERREISLAVSSRSMDPSASPSRDLLRAPINGTISAPCAATQAIAACAGVACKAAATARSRSGRPRLRRRFFPETVR